MKKKTSNPVTLLSNNIGKISPCYPRVNEADKKYVVKIFRSVVLVKVFPGVLFGKTIKRCQQLLEITISMKALINLSST